MANIALVYKNVADGGTLSGTGVSVSLPLANMQDKRLSKVARWEGLGTGTQTITFTLDLGAFSSADYGTFKGYDAIALVNHTLSPKAKISIQSSAVSNFSTDIGLDLSEDEVYKVRQADVEWNWANPKFYSKRISELDLYGFIRVYCHPMTTAQSNCDRGVIQSNGRYIKFTITDEYNESQRTYIDIGRLIVGKRLITEFNMSFGASLQYIDESIVEPSIGGELFADRRAKKRVMQFDHEMLSKSEALAGTLDLQRLSGTTEELLVITDSDDEAYGFRQNFLGRLRETSPVALWAHELYKSSYTIEEIL